MLFGHARSNVRFVLGHIERLQELELEPESVDVIVSNCVINLATDKAAVLRGAYSLLKPGGELHFADVYADRRLPGDVRADPILYGECLGGALYWNDFLELARRIGFLDPRLVTDRPIAVTDPALRDAVQDARFFSATYRLFKLPELEPACEDYGQSVTYRGTIPHAEQALRLDKHHALAAGARVPVCGNTFAILRGTRFGAHFDFAGDRSRHYGIFPDCGSAMPFSTDAAPVTGGCC